MPPASGKIRQKNFGMPGKTTSVRLSLKDYEWLVEQSESRGVSQGLVLGDAIAHYRDAQEAEISRTSGRAAVVGDQPAPAEDDAVDL